MSIKRGTRIKLLKSIKPWAPFRLHRIPVGAVGVVRDRYIEVYPQIGKKDREITWLTVLFKWTDKKGQRKRGTTSVPEYDRGKNFKVIK